MPQTREHLDICSLLGIKAGLVALTKADLVDADWLELVTRDVGGAAARPRSSPGAPIVPVSAKTGAGLDELRAALAELAATRARRGPPTSCRGCRSIACSRSRASAPWSPARSPRARARRRSASRSIRAACSPKVRGLQVPRPSRSSAALGRAAHGGEPAGRRARRRRARRRAWRRRARSCPSTLVDGTLELLADAPRPLKTRDRVRFHVGTQEVMARVLLLDGRELEPGRDGASRASGSRRRIVALPGDRFVVRSYSPIVTIGGGTLLDIAPPRFKRKAPALAGPLELLETGSPAQVARGASAAGRRRPARGPPTFAARMPFGPERLRALLESWWPRAAIVAVDREWYLHREANDRLRAADARPARGVPRREPAARRASRARSSEAGPARPQERVFAQLLASLEAEGGLESERDKVRLACSQHPAELRSSSGS